MERVIQNNSIPTHIFIVLQSMIFCLIILSQMLRQRFDMDILSVCLYVTLWYCVRTYWTFCHLVSRPL